MMPLNAGVASINGKSPRKIRGCSMPRRKLCSTCVDTKCLYYGMCLSAEDCSQYTTTPEECVKCDGEVVGDCGSCEVVHTERIT